MSIFSLAVEPSVHNQDALLGKASFSKLIQQIFQGADIVDTAGQLAMVTRQHTLLSIDHGKINLGQIFAIPVIAPAKYSFCSE